LAILKGINLAVRFLLELCLLAALAFWGWHIGQSLIARLGLSIGAPLLAAVVWGTVLSPRATVPAPAAVRLLLEVILFGPAAAGLAATGRLSLGVALIFTYAINRLLKMVWRQ